MVPRPRVLRIGQRRLVAALAVGVLLQLAVGCYNLELPERMSRAAAGEPADQDQTSQAGRAETSVPSSSGGAGGNNSSEPNVMGGTAGASGAAGVSGAAGASDQTCPAAVNCGIAACDGQSCGNYGQLCQESVCYCPGQEAVEKSCTDGADNDCDGQKDCKDSDCVDKSCGKNGLVCQSGACKCPGGSSESQCGNGLDDDCDGQTDCADPDCSTMQCGTSVNSRCCSGSCVDTETNPKHCQGCGQACASGLNCVRISDSAGVRGHCECNGTNSLCPGHPNQICRWGQSSENNLCACETAAGCAPGQVCEDITGANFCHY